MNVEIISKRYSDLIKFSLKKREEYVNAKPFPHICLDDFFNPEFLDAILSNYPDLSKNKRAGNMKTKNDNKLNLDHPNEIPEKIIWKILYKTKNYLLNYVYRHLFLVSPRGNE